MTPKTAPREIKIRLDSYIPDDEAWFSHKSWHDIQTLLCKPGSIVLSREQLREAFKKHADRVEFEGDKEWSWSAFSYLVEESLFGDK